MDDAEIQRTLGGNSARITILEQSRLNFERDVRNSLTALNTTVSDMKTSLDAANGGRRAVLWVVSAIGTLLAGALALHQLGVHF